MPNIVFVGITSPKTCCLPAAFLEHSKQIYYAAYDGNVYDVKTLLHVQSSKQTGYIGVYF